jgi:hypothetical protein
VQDYKAIRPWIMLANESSFVRDNTVLWVGLGAYSGILLMMIVVALGFDAYAGSRVALAYAAYCIALQVWLVQNFGIGSAFVPFWPGPEYFPTLQAISVAGVVLGIGFAALEFLQLRGRVRAAVAGSVLLSAHLLPRFGMARGRLPCRRGRSLRSCRGHHGAARQERVHGRCLAPPVHPGARRDPARRGGAGFFGHR